MPRQPNEKVQLYKDHEGRVAKAIKDLKENSVAAHYGLNGDTLLNRYYGKTQVAGTAHPEQRSLTKEQEGSVK